MKSDTFEHNAKKRVITVEEKIKVVKLKVKTGTMIYDGRILLIYEPSSDDDKGEGMKQKKMLKSTEAGIIRKIMVKEGDIVSPRSEIIELEKECNHPTVIKDLCAECGADLQKENVKEGGHASQASVSMVHMVPELKVNEELAQILGKADMDRLLENKKLVLLVDLDQTLIHTTNDNIPNNIKNVYHFQLYGPRSPWYHTRLRPGTHNFLQGISEKYELHICTFGSRRYAHTIARFLDPDGKFFSHRILSRDECFDSNSKTANLKALFPCGENMVCIIDDREDVWDYASNLIHVKPYHFFQHTGDIHAPPGLTKCENDDNKEGFDFSQFNKAGSGNNSGSADEMDYVDENAQDEKSNDSCDEIDDPSKNEKMEELCNGKTEMVTPTCAENEEEKEGETIQSNDVDSSQTSDCVINKEEKEGETIQSNDVDSSQTSDCVINKEEIEVPELSHKENVCSAGDETGVIKENGVPVDLIKQDENIKEKSSENEATEQISAEYDAENNEVVSTDITDEGTSEKENPSTGVGPPLESEVDAEGFINIEESDDYLLYLEEILKVIHAEFFKRYETVGEIPDLKLVVPETRVTVLQGVNIVFSGIVPNRIKLEDSPAYRIARSLGAKVTQNIESDSTHLVALRAGTAKVHAAYKRKNVKLVTPEWLWTCAERWEKVDERLFPLKNAKLNTESRHPPAHCRSPDHVEQSLPFTYPTNEPVPQSQAGDFLYTINPLMSLSSEDIECMEGEVDDIFKESDGEVEGESESEVFRPSDISSENPAGNGNKITRKRKLKEDDSNSSSISSEGEDDKFDRKSKRRKKLEKEIDGSQDLDIYDPDFVKNQDDDDDDHIDDDDDDDDEDDEDSDDETINDRFRRGEGLPSDLDIEYNTDGGTEEEQESDGEWNVMGAALEREFLDGD